MPDGDEDNPQQESDSSNSDLTRRRWLLNLGQTAAAMGLTEGVEAQQPAKPSLPPGLYDPSTDHLSHALMSSDRYHPIPTDSPTDYVRPTGEPFVPRFFSAPEFAVVRRMVEIMLAEPGSPANASGSADQAHELVREVVAWIDLSIFSGMATREANLHLSAAHRALAVAYYGESEVRSAETSDTQKISRDGLEWLADHVKAHYQSDFPGLNEMNQLEVLRAISDDRPNKETANAGTRFFTLIKDEMIRGFYTSQAGLKELDYKGNAFYASSPGCGKR